MQLPGSAGLLGSKSGIEHLVPVKDKPESGHARFRFYIGQAKKMSIKVVVLSCHGVSLEPAMFGQAFSFLLISTQNNGNV